ncbi:hypothetical protein HY495_01085 [Candidatus Woesearchaeota archaeon]|nr:hypothetical protein [Candidatus Woesearchaeota archaeon]
MRSKDITSKLTWKNVVIGFGLAIASVGLTNGYLKCEEHVGQEIFCRDYGHLKGEPRKVIDQSAAAYWLNIHPSNKERYFNTFAGWIDKCE